MLAAKADYRLPCLKSSDRYNRLRSAEDQRKVAEIPQPKRSRKNAEINQAANGVKTLSAQQPSQIAQDIAQPASGGARQAIVKAIVRARGLLFQSDQIRWQKRLEQVFLQALWYYAEGISTKVRPQTAIAHRPRSQS